jgi:hypothetical protein
VREHRSRHFDVLPNALDDRVELCFEAVKDDLAIYQLAQ